MAFANSLHKQYLGSSQGRGLRQAFLLLNRKGLAKVQTQGPFYHDLDEALYHVAEAHILESWLAVAKVDKLSDLRKQTPDQLKSLAEKLVRTRASSEALDRLDRMTHKDEPFRQVVMWNRDILQYIALDQAISHGDIGIMEAMLPALYLRFVGGGNGKYANEVMELMQGLYREWDSETAYVV